MDASLLSRYACMGMEEMGINLDLDFVIKCLREMDEERQQAYALIHGPKTGKEKDPSSLSRSLVSPSSVVPKTKSLETLARPENLRSPESSESDCERELQSNADGLRGEGESVMTCAQAIVKRAMKRVKIGMRILPRNFHAPTSEEEEQEKRDAKQLSSWKLFLRGRKKGNPTECPDDVAIYLDENLPNWRNDVIPSEIQRARDIVARANERVRLGMWLLPRVKLTNIADQEYQDALALHTWQMAWRDKEQRTNDLRYIRVYLDDKLPGWRWKSYDKYNGVRIHKRNFDTMSSTAEGNDV